MISVILPTYENPESVMCCLAALEKQTLWQAKGEPGAVPPLEIIAVDDSNSDEVEKVLIGPYWGIYYKRIRSSPPRTGRFTAGRARNMGAANAQGDLLVFIDQDVMLAPDCLANYQKAYERHGDNVVYVGLYHWMRRIEFGPRDVKQNFDAIVAAGMGATDDTFKPLPMDEPGLQGRDHREQDFGDIDHIVDDASLGAHSGNVGYPRDLFMELGGFDEAINRHGGEDADLGLSAKAHGAKFLLWDGLWGVHRWHTRNQKLNEAEVQLNIEYIDRKHGIGQYADAHKWMDARNWGDKIHYHKDVGGVLMQGNGDPTMWICRDGHRMGLATPEAVKEMGFKPSDVMMVPILSLDSYEVMGVIGG